MLFIERDGSGRITALRQGGMEAGREPASLLDDEVLAFLQESGEIDTLTHLLAMSDSSIIRVLEDLIDLLITKKIILFTDLPEEAQEKIRERKQLRRRLSGQNFMVDDIL